MLLLASELDFFEQSLTLSGKPILQLFSGLLQRSEGTQLCSNA